MKPLLSGIYPKIAHLMYVFAISAGAAGHYYLDVIVAAYTSSSGGVIVTLT